MSTTPAVVFVDIIEDQPLTAEEFRAKHAIILDGLSDETFEAAYQSYIETFQPFRWHALNAGNKEIEAHGESYHREESAEKTVRQLFSANTIVYLRRAGQPNELLRMAPNASSIRARIVEILAPDLEGRAGEIADQIVAALDDMDGTEGGGEVVAW